MLLKIKQLHLESNTFIFQCDFFKIFLQRYLFPKYEKSSNIMADICTRPCLDPTISVINRCMTEFCFHLSRDTGWFQTTLYTYVTVSTSYFDFVLPQFQINRPHFSFVFPTYVQFYTQIAVRFLKDFQHPTFLANLEKSAHMLSRSLYTIFQVTTNQSNSTIDKSFNKFQTKFRFLNNHQKIELPFYWSM